MPEKFSGGAPEFLNQRTQRKIRSAPNPLQLFKFRDKASAECAVTRTVFPQVTGQKGAEAMRTLTAEIRRHKASAYVAGHAEFELAAAADQLRYLRRINPVFARRRELAAAVAPLVRIKIDLPGPADRCCVTSIGYYDARNNHFRSKP